ncbi:hypothetical protein [Streptomyces aurantiogriseus]|uniref:Uncharacterized protein n=1 Tax=Streptomyces aurantiogriseus TaxID=66870 RepID=A0A918FI88_9ACTN|nr:hypothetical protein [Streptomyces aurantiogriseus]GGR39143.1 hypothetical protein GCM10010251_64810 [Streptomyces aurantiogriseus]
MGSAWPYGCPGGHRRRGIRDADAVPPPLTCENGVALGRDPGRPDPVPSRQLPFPAGFAAALAANPRGYRYRDIDDDINVYGAAGAKA